MTGFREEFRAGWREGIDGGGPREELRRLGAWARRLPGGIARGLRVQFAALARAAVAFLRDVLRGSPVLVRLIASRVAASMRTALRPSAPAPSLPARAGTAKEGENGEETAETGEQPPAKEETALAAEAPTGPPWQRQKAKASPKPPAAPARAAAVGRGLGDLAERLVIALLGAALLVTFSGMALGYLGQLLAPYAGGIALGAVAAWCIAAACVAPRLDAAEEKHDTTPENDHEMLAGERPEETDPWPVQREAIRNTVEALAAAGAAGHRKAKGKGIPVDDLLLEFWPDGTPQGVDRKTVITLLERAGITVRAQMKFRIGGQQKTPPGVHVDDLARDLGRRPHLPARLVPDLTPAPGSSRQAHPGD
ncbi:hypothetical protein AB0N20_27525 [Streptomyces griseoincarnatus]